MSRLRVVCLLAATLAIAFAPAASAQSTDGLAVSRVDLVAARNEGIPRIRLMVGKRWHALPSGTYRSREGASITVVDGAITAIDDPSSRTGRLAVAKVDAVALRTSFSPKLVFLDRSGRSAPLPDGTFSGASGATLLIRDGAITGFRGGG
jgi:hypothetical protein